MKNRRFLSGLAMIALVIIGIGTLVELILRKFGAGGTVNQIVAVIMHITTILGLFFVALYAYDWVKGAPNKNKQLYNVLYFVSIIVIIVVYILKYTII